MPGAQHRGGQGIVIGLGLAVPISPDDRTRGRDRNGALLTLVPAGDVAVVGLDQPGQFCDQGLQGGVDILRSQRNLGDLV